jgi:hypothetical protein
VSYGCGGREEWLFAEGTVKDKQGSDPGVWGASGHSWHWSKGMVLSLKVQNCLSLFLQEVLDRFSVFRRGKAYMTHSSEQDIVGSRNFPHLVQMHWLCDEVRKILGTDFLGNTFRSSKLSGR